MSTYEYSMTDEQAAVCVRGLRALREKLLQSDQDDDVVTQRMANLQDVASVFGESL